MKGCSVPRCTNSPTPSHRMISISVDPLSPTSPHAGKAISILPMPLCSQHRDELRHELQANGQRLLGRMMHAEFVPHDSSQFWYVVWCDICQTETDRRNPSYAATTEVDRARWMNQHRTEHDRPPVYTTETLQ